MVLFNADLLRSFAVGFVLGAIGLAVVMTSGSGGSAMVSPAVAAPANAAETNLN